MMNLLNRLFKRGDYQVFGGVARSSQWPAVRATYIKDHPDCAVCGKRNNIQCHHKRPYHLHPELELDPTNFISLCEGSGNHHLWFGHLGNFQSYNVDVETDAQVFNQKITNRP